MSDALRPHGLQHWRRQWHPTPVLLPGKSHGWRSLVGCSPWGHEDSDTTKQLQFHFSLFTFTHWRRKWQPTPVFLPGESQGLGSLVGCRLWGCTDSDTTEGTWQQQQQQQCELGRRKRNTWFILTSLLLSFFQSGRGKESWVG